MPSLFLCGYSAEDMLDNEALFDTQIFAPDTSKMMSEYRQLASIPVEKRKSAEKQRLQELAQKLRKQADVKMPTDPVLQELKKSVKSSAFRGQHDIC